MSYAIEKKFTFEAAHSLENLEEGHPCSVIHGHSYKVYIKIYSDSIDGRGFLIDFGLLKNFKNEYIDKYFDHAIIVPYKEHGNKHKGKVYVMPSVYNNTTVENMCHHMTTLLLEFFKTIGFKNFTKFRIKIFETENNSGEFTYKPLK